MSSLYNLFLTDIDDINASTIVKIYPNPIKDWVNISVENAQGIAGDILVKDLLGKSILQIKVRDLSSYQLNMDHLPAGVYVLQVKNEKEQIIMVNQKVIKL